MKTGTRGTEETRHAIVQTTDAIVIVRIEMTVRRHPGGTDIALLEITMTLLPGAKKKADGGTTRDHQLLRSKNATTSVENAGVHLLLLPAETVHEAYPLDLDASRMSSKYIFKVILFNLLLRQSIMCDALYIFQIVNSMESLARRRHTLTGQDEPYR